MTHSTLIGPQRRDFETLLIEEGPRPFNYEYAGALGKFLMEIEDRDAATAEGVTPFWLTFCTDHIYENCPAARRGGAAGTVGATTVRSLAS